MKSPWTWTVDTPRYYEQTQAWELKEDLNMGELESSMGLDDAMRFFLSFTLR
jgi:hypothetical protein